MTICVNDTGFHPIQTPIPFGENETPDRLDLSPETDPKQLGQAIQTAHHIRINFPNSADGRGFTLARLLRLQGYTGRLTAYGDVICEQYTMIRRSGFDDVEIDSARAHRQPAKTWQNRANWRENDYQNRLRGKVEALPLSNFPIRRG